MLVFHPTHTLARILSLTLSLARALILSLTLSLLRALILLSEAVAQRSHELAVSV